MTILYPIGYYYPAQNGPGNSIFWLNKALYRQQIPTLAVAMDWNIPSDIERDVWLDRNYGKVQYVRTKNYVLGWRYIIKSLQSSRQANVVHLNSIYAPTSFIIGMALMCFRRSKPIVWSVRGELSQEAQVYRGGIKKIMKGVLRLFLHKHVHFHATSDLEKEYVKQCFGLDIPIIQIPNLLELPELEHQKKRTTLLYLGRIHPIKALDILLKALKLSVTFQGTDYKLIIAGEGDLAYTLHLSALALELGISDKVEFIGKIDGKAKQQLLAAAKALILPSYSENFGNVVVEALAQKTPVIASKGTPWAILEEKKAGFWVENTVTSLAAAIDKLSNLDQEEYKQLCQNAYNLVQTTFEINSNIDRWIRAYQQVLQVENN